MSAVQKANPNCAARDGSPTHEPFVGYNSKFRDRGCVPGEANGEEQYQRAIPTLKILGTEDLRKHGLPFNIIKY